MESLHANGSTKGQLGRWNPGSWGTSPQYQLGSPSRAYEGPTPCSGWTNTPNNNYGDAGTPRDNSGSAYANAPSPYLPWTPGGQPMTPGSGGLDMMSPFLGGDSEGGLWFLPEILVNVRRSGEDNSLGVIKDVQPVYTVLAHL